MVPSLSRQWTFAWKQTELKRVRHSVGCSPILLLQTVDREERHRSSFEARWEDGRFLPRIKEGRQYGASSRSWVDCYAKWKQLGGALRPLPRLYHQRLEHNANLLGSVNKSQSKGKLKPKGVVQGPWLRRRASSCRAWFFVSTSKFKVWK